MESKATFLAAGRTDEELLERIDNRQKYLPETVEASVTELQFRKHEFSDEELKVINEDIQAQLANAAIVDGRIGLFNNNLKNVIVEDMDAPLMYSRRALYTFTVFFGVFFGALFGSILLAMNIIKTENKSNVIWVVLFGIGFTVLEFYVLTAWFNNSGAIIGGIIAAIILDFFFWQNIIGYSTFYRKRPIWVPLIIGSTLAVLIIWLAILGMQQPL